MAGIGRVSITLNSTNDYQLSNDVWLTGINDNNGFDEIGLVNVTTNPYFEIEGIELVGTTTSPHNIYNLFSVFGIGPIPGTVPYQPFSEITLPKGYSTATLAPPVAFECLLQFCVRNMSARFINSSLTETINSEWTNTSQLSAGSTV
jgi:hypothetical protein